MKTLILIFSLGLWLSGCSSDASKISNARFEIEQGNIENAKKILNTIPAASPVRPAADSILKALESR